MLKKRERNGPQLQTDSLSWPIKFINIFLVNQENTNLSN